MLPELNDMMWRAGLAILSIPIIVGGFMFLASFIFRPFAIKIRQSMRDERKEDIAEAVRKALDEARRKSR